MRNLLTILFLLITINIYSQEYKIFEQLPNSYSTFQKVELVEEDIKEIINTKPKQFTFNDSIFTKINIYDKKFVVNTSTGKYVYEKPLIYQSNTQTFVFKNNRLTSIVPNQYSIQNFNGKHFKVIEKTQPFECLSLEVENKVSNITQFNNSCKVIKNYFELDYRTFKDRGSLENTLDYFSAVFAAVSQIYSNQNKNILLSEVFVWTEQDPYPSHSSSVALYAFRDKLNGNFNGNLAHLVSTLPRGNGGVAYLDVLNNPYYGVAYSNIDNNYNAGLFKPSNLINYSWTIDVIAHEMGHQIGAWHTHSCEWNNLYNTGGTLDNCYNAEGDCTVNKSSISTVMSYGQLGRCTDEQGNKIEKQLTFHPLVSDHMDLKISQTNLDFCENTVNFYFEQVFYKDNKLFVMLRGEGTVELQVNNKIHLIDSPNLFILDEKFEGLVYLTIDPNNKIEESLENDNKFTLEIVNNYCESQAINQTFEWIDNVEITQKNDSLIFTCIPGFKNTSFFENWKVWVDWNKDYVFNELVFDQVSDTTFNFSVKIPDVFGDINIRVSMKWEGENSEQESCSTFNYGEVEDYKFSIQEPECILELTTKCYDYIKEQTVINFNNSKESATIYIGIDTIQTQNHFFVVDNEVEDFTITNGCTTISN